jgi:hypothetical protein
LIKKHLNSIGLALPYVEIEWLKKCQDRADLEGCWDSFQLGWVLAMSTVVLNLIATHMNFGNGKRVKHETLIPQNINLFNILKLLLS